jgi:hypothetical protein
MITGYEKIRHEGNNKKEGINMFQDCEKSVG